jgi:hypothetical protein
MHAAIVRLLGALKLDRAPRPVDVVADDLGVSSVLANGATSRAFRWRDVSEIRAFKRDLLVVDDIRLAFQADGVWHEFSEELRGFSQLSEVMGDIFESIPLGWHAEVMFPPFTTNERVLFLGEPPLDGR